MHYYGTMTTNDNNTECRLATFEEISFPEETLKDSDLLVLGMAFMTFASVSNWGNNYIKKNRDNSSLDLTIQAMSEGRSNEHYKYALDAYSSGMGQDFMDYFCKRVFITNQSIPFEQVRNHKEVLRMIYSNINIFKYFKKEILKTTESDETEIQSNYFLEPKAKISGLFAKFEKYIWIRTETGYYNRPSGFGILEFKTEEGNVVIWKTASDVEIPEVGQCVFFTAGAVKENKEYKNVKQTIVARAKYSILDEV